jgi:succinate-semialdehyde dehydrogenase/glutarate-semialdehyde dehydrogenase
MLRKNEMKTHAPTRYINAQNPVTGEILGRIPLDSAADLPLRVQRARLAQERWAGLSVKERMPYFYAVLQYLTEHTDELAETIARDNGKTRLDALAAEVRPGALATQ